jgi:hypothetical protein
MERMESRVGYEPMSYLSSRSIVPSSLGFHETYTPFAHWTVYSESELCSFYDPFLRVRVRKIQHVNEMIRIYLEPESLLKWKAIEAVIVRAIPRFESGLRVTHEGEYLSIPKNIGSQTAVHSNPSVLHLRLKWIYKTSYGAHRVLLYIYDGTPA